jgi:serine phosphatase RsbU (regulator of sigma subunit)/anti-sigma regulatory factor (Ser/Thr protein kinase)
VAGTLTRRQTDRLAGQQAERQPLAIPTAPLPGDLRSPARRPTRSSILLVDDNEDGLAALRAVLEPLGQRLVAVGSGEDALRRLLHEEFAVILLDVRMPGIDGFETARYINSRARTRHIPIIFLTGQAEDVEQVFHAYAAGAVDYVVKPIDPEVLRSKVAVFVELQRERGERVREAQARAQAEAIAGTLQQHLLPDRLPRVPALAMAARYRPGEHVAQVGGDWYDALVLSERHVGVVIGDAVGHGVRAATLMGELRSALRAYAIEEPGSPGMVLARLNALMARTHGAGMVATLLYMVIDLDGEDVRYASAGHLPALVRAPEGATRFLEHPPLPPLGVCEHTAYESWAARIEPGATVLLYTDGLVERRGESIDVGLTRLRKALAGAPEELEQLCSGVLAELAGGVVLRDDAALLALRPLRHSSPRLELELPAEPDSVALVRHRLERWLTDTGCGRDDVFAIKLAVSEACANAVEHAYGPERGHTFTLSAQRDGEAVAIEVRDGGHWRPPRGSARGLGLQIIEQLMDKLELEQTGSGTVVRMEKQPESGPAADPRGDARD